METLTAKQAVDLLSDSPLYLGWIINQEGQKVDFYADENYGGMIYAVINNIWAETGFFEVDDMIESHGEYTPILDDDNTINCAFEYYNYGECKPLENSFIHP